jgi:hypothetical protein
MDAEAKAEIPAKVGAGIPSETPLRMVTLRLEEMGAPFIVFNQRQFANCEI